MAMRFFRREVEVTLKAFAALMLLALLVLPIAWGYEQRQKARTWQNIACAYRIKEIERRAPIVAGLSHERDACGMLERLGLDLDQPPRATRFALAQSEKGRGRHRPLEVPR